MKIDQREIAPGTMLISIVGSVMLGSESERIMGLVDDLLRQGKRTIIFDLSGVTAIDSTGIGRFISSYNKIVPAGGEMRMAGATSHILQAFHVTRLDTVFRFYPTLDEALTGS
jgi:anti-anti-sigma factor